MSEQLILIRLSWVALFMQDDQEEVAESAVVGYPHDIKGEGKTLLSPKGDNSSATNFKQYVHVSYIKYHTCLNSSM